MVTLLFLSSTLTLATTSGVSESSKMNINKKLGRMKQWAGERMGGEVQTSLSDDFKSLEVEMGLRRDGEPITSFTTRQS